MTPPPEIRVIIDREAEKYGLDPNLLSTLLWKESRFNPKAKSPAGAMGISQLMPGTAKELGVDPWDVEQAIGGAAKYLKTQINTFGDVTKGLMAYNWGPGSVGRWLKAGADPDRVPAETKDYVRDITGRWENAEVYRQAGFMRGAGPPPSSKSERTLGETLGASEDQATGDPTDLTKVEKEERKGPRPQVGKAVKEAMNFKLNIPEVQVSSPQTEQQRGFPGIPPPPPRMPPDLMAMFKDRQAPKPQSGEQKLGAIFPGSRRSY